MYVFYPFLFWQVRSIFFFCVQRSLTPSKNLYNVKFIYSVRQASLLLFSFFLGSSIFSHYPARIGEKTYMQGLCYFIYRFLFLCFFFFFVNGFYSRNQRTGEKTLICVTAACRVSVCARVSVRLRVCPRTHIYIQNNFLLHANAYVWVYVPHKKENGS